MRGAWLGLALAAGCGRSGFDSTERGDARALDDGDMTDVASDAFVVCHTGSWSVPQPLVGVDTSSHESDPAFTADGLTVFYVSNAGASMGYALWSATRASLVDPFTNAGIVSELDAVADDFDPSISPDGLTIYFESFRGVDAEIWTASRTSTALPFDPPTLVSIVGETQTRFRSPFVSADGLSLYYASGGLEIAYATRTVPSGPFTFVRELDEVNVPSTDSSPIVSADGLELFFESSRTGSSAMYRSTRASTADLWGPEVELTELVTLVPSATAAGGPELTPDGRTLYMFLNVGQIDIYVSTRSCN